MSSTVINTEALQSGIYNPPLDPKVLQLQQLMETTAISPTARHRPRKPPLINPSDVELPLQEHIQTFNSLSIFNPYQGVVVNPTSCLLDPIRSDLSGFSGYLNGALGDNDQWQAYAPEFQAAVYGSNVDANAGDGQGSSSLGTSAADKQTAALMASGFTLEQAKALGSSIANIPGNPVPDPSGADNPEDDYDGDADTGLLDDLDSYEDHTDKLTNNLPSLAGIAQAAMALDTVMSLLSNPCLGLDGFLGSIMNSGKQLLADLQSKLTSMISGVKSLINSALGDINKVIGPVIAQIKAGIAQAQAAVAALIAKAKAEITKFAKALLAQARQGLAELMANLPQDPCLKSLLGSVATGAAAAIIGG